MMLDISSCGERKRGRPRRIWDAQLSMDMKALNLKGDNVLECLATTY